MEGNNNKTLLFIHRMYSLSFSGFASLILFRSRAQNTACAHSPQFCCCCSCCVSSCWLLCEAHNFFLSWSLSLFNWHFHCVAASKKRHNQSRHREWNEDDYIHLFYNASTRPPIIKYKYDGTKKKIRLYGLLKVMALELVRTRITFYWDPFY